MAYLAGLLPGLGPRECIDHGQVLQAARIDRIDGNPRPVEGTAGLTNLVAGIVLDGEWAEDRRVGKESQRKRAGEPDQILAAGKAAKITSDGLEGIDGVVDALLRLE